MRTLLLVPVLLATLACSGKARLSRQEAERDIRQDYPVVVAITVPETEKAVKGSPEHARLVALQEELGRTGWFQATRTADGDRDQFAFRLASGAPRNIQASARGFLVPVAQAEFVRAVALEPVRDGARVTYQIRLVKPTPQFHLFQELHPGVRIGETKDRHASYRREGRNWILQDTDETFRKAN